MNERFARHGLIPDWDQRRLSRATAIVVGVGALGNEVTRLLALAGIGTLVLCDPDRVAASNLSRAPLFRESDVGRLKVEAAADALRQCAPELRLDLRPLEHVSGVGLAELRDASLVLSCLDSRAARLQLAGRCNLVGAPCLDGGTQPWGGEVRPFLDPAGACYGCGLGEAQRGQSDVPWSCLDAREPENVGAAAPSSALIASWMAIYALRRIMGIPVASTGLVIDGAAGTSTPLVLPRDPACPLHGRVEAVTQVPVHNGSTVAALRAAVGAGTNLLLWKAAALRVECPRCDFTAPRVGQPTPGTCPRCGAAWRPRTSLEIDDFPGGTRLHALGVAPREILTARNRGGYRWLELQDARESRAECEHGPSLSQNA